MMSHKRFIRSAVRQLLMDDQTLFRFFKPYYRAYAPADAYWDIESMKTILYDISAASTSFVCIVDAMDESESQRELVLNLLTDLVSSKDSRTKFIILSRPSRDIDRRFRSSHLVHRILLQMENVEDIAKIVEHGLQSLQSAMKSFDSSPEEPSQASVPIKPGARHRRSMKKNQKQPRALSFEDLRRHTDPRFRNIRRYLIENAQGVILWLQ